MDATSTPLTQAAERESRLVLAGHRERIAHVRAAACTAADLAAGLDPRLSESLIAAAWLHDIGYASAVVQTGFHPLDGALHLARAGWPDHIVRLVAHHSHAEMLAPYYGVENHLRVLDPVPGLVADILTYADLTAGPDGRGASVSQRIADMRVRHARSSPVPARVREARYRRLEAAAARVVRRSLRERAITASA